MLNNVYEKRLQYLKKLPAYFTLSEFRALSGLSRDSAWHTCHYWVKSGVAVQENLGVFRNLLISLKYHPLLHRAFAGGMTGYVTGEWVLAWHRVIRKYPTRLDMVTNDRRSGLTMQGGTQLRYHRLKSISLLRGITEVPDGGRILSIADPERVVVDCLINPRHLMPVTDVLSLLEKRKLKFRQFKLLDVVLECRSETVWRRMRVLARIARMKRLEKWLDQQGWAPSTMGRVILDPTRPVLENAPTYKGVIINVPFDDSRRGLNPSR